jgi:hypothetical protein
VESPRTKLDMTPNEKRKLHFDLRQTVLSNIMNFSTSSIWVVWFTSRWDNCLSASTEREMTHGTV